MIDKKSISFPKDAPVFLATTAIEGFWDTTMPMVFLGDWCLRYSRRSVWAPLNANVMPNIWQNKNYFKDQYKYLIGLHERVLAQLVEVLNDMHSKSYSERYWRIVIGPWLFQYIGVMYDRYLSVIKTLEKYPNITSMCLAKECFVTALDSSQYGMMICNDPYNLQLYSKILSMLSVKCGIKKLDVTGSRMQTDKWCGRLESMIRVGTSKIMQTIANVIAGNEQIVLNKSYISSRETLALFWKTNFAVWPFHQRISNSSDARVNEGCRINYNNISFGASEFDNFLARTIMGDMPISYIENYKHIEARSLKYPKKPKAILSAASWYTMEEFKLWAARSSELGTLLLGSQHGGGTYGISSYMWPPEHELKITDRYYSWGWEKEDNHSKVIPLTIPQMIGIRTRKVKNTSPDILFALTCLPRYLHRYSIYSQQSFGQSIKRQMQFASCLPHRLRSHLRVRLYQDDRGWDVRERWIERHPDVVLEGWNVAFMKRLAKCRIFVVDQLFTTYAESLAANKPTIVFSDPAMMDFILSALKIFQNLRDVGILHDTPESAAKMVEDVYNDVESWWNGKALQNVRMNFCENLARCPPNAIDEWTSEMKAVLTRS